MLNLKKSSRKLEILNQPYLLHLSSESYMGAKEFEMDALGFHFPSHIGMMFHWKKTRVI